MQQAELHIPDESCYHELWHGYNCPKCGGGHSKLEIMVNPMGNTFVRRYRITCRSIACGTATEWMDSSHKALQVWKVQSILARK